MNTPSKSLLLLAAFSLAACPVALRAQYNPPPPPDQVDQGGAPPDQSAPPPQDQPMDQDQGQGAPPPDDQGAPPPDDQGGGAPDNGSGGSADFQTFYNDLDSQGTWVQTDNYGYVWQPAVQDPDWAPYRNGHWVYTDEGWAWVADDSEPWGWATYHYGRWVNIDGEGWAWVPGYTWAPAWVSWRYGGGYAGWAPLPPDTFVGVDVGGVGFGFHIGGDCDTAYGIGPGYYNFVQVGFLGDRDYRGHYENRYDNYRFINNTRNVTNIVINNQRGANRFGRVNAGGPNFATINAQSHTPLQRAQLTRSGRVGDARLRGNQLAVYAPHVNAAPSGQSFHPQRVGGHLTSVQVNRGTDINRPLFVNSRVRGTAPSSAQVQAARAAQAHIAPNAHVAMGDVRPTQALSRPLTSYQPHVEARTNAARTQEAAVHGATGINHPMNNAATRPAGGISGDNARRTDETVNHAATQGNENATAEAQRAQAERANATRLQNERATERAAVERANTEHTENQRNATDREQTERVQPDRTPGDRDNAERVNNNQRPMTDRAETERVQPDRTAAVHSQEEHTAMQHAPAQHAAPAPHPAPASHSAGNAPKDGDKKQ